MRIEIDYDFNDQGRVIATHIFETRRVDWNKTPHPDTAVLVDSIDYVAALTSSPLKLASSGWQVISKHPLYPGKTRLEVLKAEVVRLNDSDAKAVLGV